MSNVYDRQVTPGIESVSGTFDTLPMTHTHRRVSWGAIFGGVVLAVALQILFSLLGAGIGLDTVNVAAGSTPDGSSFGIGAGVWWVSSTIIALFAGGYAAAWLAGNEIRFDGMLHGLVAWGITTILTLYLLSSAVGGLIGGGFSALSSVASASGSAVKDTAAPIAKTFGVSPDMVQQQVQTYLQPTNPDPATMSPADAQKMVAQDLVTYERGGPDAPAARADIITISAAQMKISRAEATKKFDDTQAKIKQAEVEAKRQATIAADATASGASKASFAVFVDLLLGAIAAALGGTVAIRRRVIQPGVVRSREAIA